MARMTDEEADILDEKYTRTPPKPGPNGTGFFSRRKAMAHTITIDELSADYLFTKALADHKTPAEVISEMVREKIAVGA